MRALHTGHVPPAAPACSSSACAQGPHATAWPHSSNTVSTGRSKHTAHSADRLIDDGGPWPTNGAVAGATGGGVGSMTSSNGLVLSGTGGACSRHPFSDASACCAGACTARSFKRSSNAAARCVDIGSGRGGDSAEEGGSSTTSSSLLSVSTLTGCSPASSSSSSSWRSTNPGKRAPSSSSSASPHSDAHTATFALRISTPPSARTPPLGRGRQVLTPRWPAIRRRKAKLPAAMERHRTASASLVLSSHCRGGRRQTPSTHISPPLLLRHVSSTARRALASRIRASTVASTSGCAGDVCCCCCCCCGGGGGWACCWACGDGIRCDGGDRSSDCSAARCSSITCALMWTPSRWAASR